MTTPAAKRRELHQAEEPADAVALLHNGMICYICKRLREVRANDQS